MSEASYTLREPAKWLDSLERSKAQIAASQTVPLLQVFDRLQATAECLEAERGVTFDEERLNSFR